MLWALVYKGWRETRARFLLSVAALAALCLAFVVFRTDGGSGGHPLPYAEYVWRSTYKGYLRELFVGLAVMLGVGGLRQESATGTAGFTLALPVSRARLATARALVGLAEVAALAAVPAVVIPTASAAVGAHYAPSQAVAFGVLWAVGGALCVAFGVAASALAGGAATALAVAFTGLLAYSVAADVPGLERYVPNVHDVMSGSGMPYFHEATCTLVGPIPWPTLTAVLLVMVAVVAVAERRVRRLDF